MADTICVPPSETLIFGLKTAQTVTPDLGNVSKFERCIVLRFRVDGEQETDRQTWCNAQCGLLGDGRIINEHAPAAAGALIRWRFSFLSIPLSFTCCTMFIDDGMPAQRYGVGLRVGYTIVWSGIHECIHERLWYRITYLFHDRRPMANTGLRTARSTGHASVEWVMGRYFNPDTLC